MAIVESFIPGFLARNYMPDDFYYPHLFCSIEGQSVNGKNYEILLRSSEYRDVIFSIFMPQNLAPWSSF